MNRWLLVSLALAMSAACLTDSVRAQEQNPAPAAEARQPSKRELIWSAMSADKYVKMDDAIDLVLGGQLRENTLIDYLVRNGASVAEEFGHTVERRVMSEAVEATPTGPPCFKDPVAVRTQYRIWETLERRGRSPLCDYCSRPDRVLQYADPETAVAVARAYCACRKPYYSSSWCDRVLDGLMRAKHDADPAYIPALMVVVRAYIDIADMANPRPVYWQYGGRLYVMATATRYPLAVRLEALGALRGRAPAHAETAFRELAKDKLEDQDIAELQRILVESDTSGGRLEALLLLAVAGKANDVKANLEKALAEATAELQRFKDALNAQDKQRVENGNQPPELARLEARRSNIAFALRLLNGGKSQEAK